MDSASPSPTTSPSGYGMLEEMELDAAVAQRTGLARRPPAKEESRASSRLLRTTPLEQETEERFEHFSAMAGSSSVKLSAGRGTRQSLTEEKESAMEEYLSLRNANAQLKEQIANTARGEIDMNSAAIEVESSACPTIAFFDQTTTVSVRPLHVPPCALVPCRSVAGAEKEAIGDSQVKAAAAVDDKGKQTGCHQTPDEVLRTAAAAAAAARKRRKELTKLKHHHAR